MNTKKISVLVAAFNVENTISQTINSILDQSYKNIEIIVINDGSRDNTENVLKTFGDKITVITTQNSGLGAARNLGLKMASGEYIMFIDGDDYLTYNNVISDFVNCAEKDLADLVVADFNYVDEDGNTISKRSVNATIESMYSGAWNKLYSKSLWKNVQFPENILYEDAGVVMSIALSANRITVLHKPVYAYRQSKKTITQSLNSVERHLDSIKSIEPYTHKIIESKKDCAKSAVRYINHLMLGHLIVVKTEYVKSDQQIAVVKEIVKYMESPLLRNQGFSKNIFNDSIQKLLFWTLKTDNIKFVMDVLLKSASNVRNRRRNKRV